MADITLTCLVYGEFTRNAFFVNIDKNANVDQLKKLIKDARPDILSNIVQSQISLWKVDIEYEPNANAIKVLEDAAAAPTLPVIDIKQNFSGVDLVPFRKISHYFEDSPSSDIHIVADYPRGKHLSSFHYPKIHRVLYT